MAGKKNESAWTVVAEALRLDPSISDRAVAEFLEIVSHSFVGIVRRAMVARGELPEIKARVCLDRRKRHLPRTAEEKEQLRQEIERVRQEKEQLRQENERVRQEKEQEEKLAQEAREQRWHEYWDAKITEIQKSLMARPSYSNRYHAYKCRVRIWRVKSIRQEMIAKGELPHGPIPQTKAEKKMQKEVQKEVFRQERLRREKEGLPPCRQREKEAAECWKMIKDEEHEFNERLRKAVPLNQDFGKTRHGKGRANRKPRKRDEDD